MRTALGLALGLSFLSGGAGSAPPPGPWDPSLLPGLWAYHDADSIASLAQDAGGTTPVTADGDRVGLWRDLSGFGHDLSQATSGLRMAYDAHDFGGKPSIIGAGGGIHLDRTGGIMGAQTWALIYQSSFAPFVPQALASLGGTHPGIIQLSPTGGAAPEVGFAFSATSGTSALVGFSPGLDTSTHRLIVTFDGTTYRAWWDGVEQVVTVTAATTATDGTCGALFARNDNSDRVGGFVRRLAWAAGVASAGDIANLDTWLQG